MQSSERNGLAIALKSYSSAVARMERTVLLPSLLRDVPAGKDGDESCRDLYSDYLMLKAARCIVESGAPRPRAHDKGEAGVPAEAERLLRFHLNGLLAAVEQLTRRSQSLTHKYLDIIGVSR
ncbi:mid1-interacting protein 1-B-like [Corythoichthys intestinalis]|uniref:mid1-interacting protein 1-B-like n=1 Tax=Corythoichthys intestinalis TaxID=161448 RepID=UPI0025A56176|nr:mid1-interacting protein 1-B-like [Corythoichthys intestinalis]XP_061797563.1 mid1-interacting protein 1-B-like [Nerophis lumbriciformis]